MENYGVINIDKLIPIMGNLTGSECKVLLFILCELSNSTKEYYINNSQSRSILEKQGFDKSPERICAVLSSLVKKGVLKRIANSIYTVGIPDLYYKRINFIPNNTI